MEIFGSYLRRDHTLASEGVSIVLLDTFVALMAGLITLPACFAYDVEPSAGVSLLFISLPNVFNHMTGGRIWGTLFFIFMFFAALSTVVAVFESLISYYIDLLGWSRRKSVGFNIVLMIILSMPAVLGFNVLSGIQPLGAGTNLMDLEDFLVSSNLLPLGSLVFVLFCTRKNGWGWENALQEMNAGKGFKLPGFIRGYMSYGLPAIIILVYLKGYYDYFKPKGTGMLIGWIALAIVLVAAILFIAFKPQKKQHEHVSERPEAE